MATFAPEVSVIIPMYNAEKYLSECLESLLAQTFKNFEVIIVDDCSTDSSPEIVESYAEKFGGRLILSHTEKNSGSGALPRNKGLSLSRGEYVQFLDADDMLTKTALEELHVLAKNFDADVVYCEKWFNANEDGTNPKVYTFQHPPLVNEPIFESEDLAQRVESILKIHYWVTPWTKFVRRRLIFEHEIFFPHTVISEDDVWAYALFFYAKKFLRVPNVVYIQRLSEYSMMRAKRTPQQTINFWINPVLFGSKSLDDLMSRHEFFRQNPQFRYAILERFIKIRFDQMLAISVQLKPFEIYETLKQKYGYVLGEHDVLISALCTALNKQHQINAISLQQFKQFAEAAEKSIAELEAEIRRLKS